MLEDDAAVMLMTWWASGFGTGIIVAFVLYFGLRYLYKRLFVWPHHPKYSDPREPNL